MAVDVADAVEMGIEKRDLRVLRPNGLGYPRPLLRLPSPPDPISVKDDSADNLEAAWAELHTATPPGWQVGRPSEHPERQEWLMYAFDPAERPRVGLRTHEWTAIANSEEAVVLEMARCLRAIGAGLTPK